MRPLVDGGAVDHEHEEEGQHHLDQERLAHADPGARRRGAHLDAVEDAARHREPEHGRPRDGAQALGDDVAEGGQRPDLASGQGADRDSGVEVGPADGGRRADHHSDGETVGQRDPDQADVALGQGVGRDRAGADIDQGEGADELGDQRPRSHRTDRMRLTKTAPAT